MSTCHVYTFKLVYKPVSVHAWLLPATCPWTHVYVFHTHNCVATNPCTHMCISGMVTVFGSFFQ